MLTSITILAHHGNVNSLIELYTLFWYTIVKELPATMLTILHMEVLFLCLKESFSLEFDFSLFI